MQRVRHIIRRFNFNEQIIWFIWRLKWNHLTISVIMFYNYTAIVIITLAQRFSCKRSSAFALRAKKIIVLRLCAEKRTHPIYLYVCRIGRERERERRTITTSPIMTICACFRYWFWFDKSYLHTNCVLFYTYICVLCVRSALVIPLHIILIWFFDIISRNRAVFSHCVVMALLCAMLVAVIARSDTVRIILLDLFGRNNVYCVRNDKLWWTPIHSHAIWFSACRACARVT